MKMTADHLCFLSWTVTRTLPTLMKTDEMSTTRSTCLYKLDPADVTSSDQSEQASLETSVSLGSGGIAKRATAMVFVKYLTAIAR